MVSRNSMLNSESEIWLIWLVGCILLRWRSVGPLVCYSRAPVYLIIRGPPLKLKHTASQAVLEFTMI